MPVRNLLSEPYHERFRFSSRAVLGLTLAIVSAAQAQTATTFAEAISPNIRTQKPFSRHLTVDMLSGRPSRPRPTLGWLRNSTRAVTCNGKNSINPQMTIVRSTR